jgi:hypothetical protein
VGGAEFSGSHQTHKHKHTEADGAEADGADAGGEAGMEEDLPSGELQTKQLCFTPASMLRLHAADTYSWAAWIEACLHHCPTCNISFLFGHCYSLRCSPHDYERQHDMLIANTIDTHFDHRLSIANWQPSGNH